MPLFEIVENCRFEIKGKKIQGIMLYTKKNRHYLLITHNYDNFIKEERSLIMR
jgi:hypothetical protein